MTPKVYPVRNVILGENFPIKRALPQSQLRNIGAWVFLDHAGPSTFETGNGMDVGPHPHIGLQTFTWILQGEVIHRDSLNNNQVIRPYQVNLMTAGRGISHTEVSHPNSKELHVAQLWIALPKEKRDIAPDFEHYPDIPHIEDDCHHIHILVGEYHRHISPVKVHSAMTALDIQGKKDTSITIDLKNDFEHGILLLEGSVAVNQQSITMQEIMYLPTGIDSITLQLTANSRLLLIGGTPLSEKPIIWWNFVSWSHEEIVQAREDWQRNHERFGEVSGYSGKASRFVAPEITNTLK